MDPDLQKLADTPLEFGDNARCRSVWLPEGRRPLHRGKKPVYHGNMGGAPLSPKQVRERKSKAESAKIVELLDYYSKTQVPFERIAKHAGLTIEQVRYAMRGRGRLA